MTATKVSTTSSHLGRLQWWMRGVGCFYLLLAAFNTPPAITARLPMQYPELGVGVDSSAAQALVDVWFMFGLELAVVGAALLYFSRRPLDHIALVWTVLGLELVRGIADDLYLLARGYNTAFYSAWVVVHLAIIVSGAAAVRRAQRDAGHHAG